MQMPLSYVEQKTLENIFSPNIINYVREEKINTEDWKNKQHGLNIGLRKGND